MKGLFRSILIISGILLLNGQAYSQRRYPADKVEIAGGFGWPDNGVVKIKYGKDLQIALSQGFMLNTAVEIYYHFAGKPMFTDQKVWYGVAGMEYFYWDKEENLWFPYLRAGRTFNLDRRYGMNLDLGVFYQLVDSDFYPGSGLQPSGSFTFFVRF